MTHRLDRPAAGDVDSVIAAMHTRMRGGDWDSYVRPLLQDAPEHVVIARDAHDRLSGFCISATPAATSPVVRDDEVLGPWLAHTRAHRPDEDVLVWRLHRLHVGPRGNVHSPVIALMNTAAMMRCGLKNIRRSYLPIDPHNPVARASRRAWAPSTCGSSTSTAVTDG